MHRGQLAGVHRGGIWRPLRVPVGVHLVTLRRFDSEVPLDGQNSPLIPCERRHAETEISEFQEVTFGPRFGNREYDRPYRHILATLHGFD